MRLANEPGAADVHGARTHLQVRRKHRGQGHAILSRVSARCAGRIWEAVLAADPKTNVINMVYQSSTHTNGRERLYGSELSSAPAIQLGQRDPMCPGGNLDGPGKVTWTDRVDGSGSGRSCAAHGMCQRTENKIMTDCFNVFDDAAASTPGIQPLKNGAASKRLERDWCRSRVHAYKLISTSSS